MLKIMMSVNNIYDVIYTKYQKQLNILVIDQISDLC